MITALWIVSLLAGAVAVGDMMRRPQSEWVAADRDRGYWVTMSVLGGLTCLGLVAGAVYLVSIVPLLQPGAGPDAAFRKQSAAGQAGPPPVAVLSPPRAVAPAEPRPAPALWASPPEPPEALPTTEPRGRLVIDLDDV